MQVWEHFVTPSFDCGLRIADCGLSKHELSAITGNSQFVTDLLMPKRDQRVHLGCAPRRNETGNESDTEQYQGNARESRRIGHAHAVEQILQHARQAPGAD